MHQTLDRVLPAYVNGGCLSRWDRLVSLAAPGLPFRWHARRVAAAAGPPSLAPARGAVAQEVRVPPYDGGDPHVRRMRDYLARHLGDDLAAALVHGSLGTDEAVPYSDFDALVLLRDVVFETPARLVRVARALDGARGIMLDYDPLQHHGWFVLAERHLDDYPDSYLPAAALAQARALLPVGGAALRLQVRPRPERHQAAFEALCAAVCVPLLQRRYPRDLYGLKLLLSQFMLLPARYVQARDGEGVFKRESFDRARGDFPAAVWTVMDDVSALRRAWSCDLPPWRRRLLTLRSPGRRRVARHAAPPLAPALRHVLTDAFYARMADLAAAMSSRLALHGRPAAPVAPPAPSPVALPEVGAR